MYKTGEKDQYANISHRPFSISVCCQSNGEVAVLAECKDYGDLCSMHISPVYRLQNALIEVNNTNCLQAWQSRYPPLYLKPK